MSTADESVAAVSASLKLQTLLSVNCYPVPATSVELIETHFAWVFLVGDYAYKMKKPFVFPLLDLRSIADRQRNCLEEVRLNRRLAPDVYLGAVPLSLTKEGTLRVDGEGSAVDWLIWMKRLPAASMLDRAITEKTSTPVALTEVGVLLARFYERQQRYFYPARYYLSQLVERTTAEGAALLAPGLKLDATMVHSAVAAVHACLNALHVELGDRALEGRVVECHGDLRPEHICLAPVCVIDSLEFSRKLRVLDPAEELAYLRLECDVAGAPEVAEQIIAAYKQQSCDRFSQRLLDCYQSCRALVRAKILAWHILDPAVALLAPWTEKAQALVALAERHATLGSDGFS
jgi:aminoglycoside phosphotransferase family enzyme